MTAILVANFVCFESRKIPMVQMLNNFDTQNSKQSKAKQKTNEIHKLFMSKNYEQ